MGSLIKFLFDLNAMTVLLGVFVREVCSAGGE